MAGRNSVSYVKPAEPAFIKRIKEKVGFKEGPTIETKKETLAVDDDGREKDDEKPVVVVLKPGDLSQEEADSILEKFQDDEKSEDENHDDEADEEEAEVKITFKKPVKRSVSDEAGVSSTSNTSSSTKKIKSAAPVRKPSWDGDKKQVKNRSLLSFDDEENDD